MSRTEYETSNSRFEKCTKYSTGCMFIVGPSAMLDLTTERAGLLQRACEQVADRVAADLTDRVEHCRCELRRRFRGNAQPRQSRVEPRRIRQRSRHGAEFLRRVEILLRAGHHLRNLVEVA